MENRVLVIDDSRAMRTILKGMMKDLGFTVSEAQHGKEALEKIASEGPPNLALVDWNMPEMNGIDFVCELRKEAKFSDVRVVMVTTEAETANVIRALDAGADEYVMKPFTKDMLVEKLSLIGFSAP